MNILELSEQEIGRRESLQQLRQMGINPYPAAEFPVNAWSTDILENFEDLPVIGKDEEGNDVRETPTPENSRMVSIAGRIMSTFTEESLLTYSSTISISGPSGVIGMLIISNPNASVILKCLS